MSSIGTSCLPPFERIKAEYKNLTEPKIKRARFLKYPFLFKNHCFWGMRLLVRSLYIENQA